MKDFERIIAELGDSDSNQGVSDWLSTGVLPLNHAMSGQYEGGLPVGRITEIYGPPSSGKTLVATRAMIETQKKGGYAALFDYEHAFSIDRAVTLGLKNDASCWLYKQPTTAEQGFAMIQKLCEIMRNVDPARYLTVVVDSTASMVTKAELEAGFEDSNMKTRLSLASFMSAALKILEGIVSRTNTTMIFLNQVRDNPGVMFGDKETTPGGNAQKFYASLRVRLRKSGQIKDDEKRIIGEQIVAYTVKNKVYRPFVETVYISNFDMGVDLVATHINALAEMGKFGDSKGWLEFGGEKFRESKLIDRCRADEAFYQSILAMFTDGEKQ